MMPSTNRAAAFRSWLADNFTPSPLFVLQGAYYFLRHRYMWSLLKTRLLPLTLLSLLVVTLLFLTTYLPQVAVLLLFHGRDSAWVNGAFLVLGEANLVIAILFEAFLVDKTQVDSFDAVLVARGHEDLVRKRRPVTAAAAAAAVAADPASDDPEEARIETNPLKRLGPREKGACFAPFSFRQIFEFVVLLPLNLIPYAGVPLFLLLTGYRAGPLLQYRYHAMLGLNKRDRRAFVKTKSMRWQYMWFGTVYLILQLIPVLSMFFLITGAAGSALWAADMESRKQQRRNNNNHMGPRFESQDYDEYAEEDDDLPPAYTDDI